MRKSQCLPGTIAVAVLLVACSNEGVGETSIGAQDSAARNGSVAETVAAPDYIAAVADPGSPYTISYRIIGSPIAGSPVTLGLRVDTMSASGPITLDYRINDASSMTFPESQLTHLQTEPPAGENYITQQVTVVPQREGRVYLNVSASYDTGDGARATIVAIPIEVAAAGRNGVEAAVPVQDGGGDFAGEDSLD